MARIDIKSGGTILNDGILQLENGVAMDATLRNVADQNNTTSPLKLSTTAVQVASPLRITTDDPSDMYLDCEDGATNNRFNITRNTTSQQVNLNFASNPAGSTTIVGAIRTYVDGVNLSEVMTFREDGRVGVINTNPQSAFDVSGTILGSTIGNKNGNPVIGSDGTNIALGVNFASRIIMVSSRTDISTNNVAVARFSQSGNTLLDTTASDTARLSIKGSGSTSATTSLLVQNSSGTQTIKATDDNIVAFGPQNFTLDGGNCILHRGGVDTESIAFNLSRMVFTDSNGFVFNNTSFASALTASSIVDIKSTTKGFLPPRMTTAQKNAIGSPAAGLMVYDTTLNKLCVRTAAAWETITSV